MDDDTCRKKLTSYAAYSIRKAASPDKKKDGKKKDGKTKDGKRKDNTKNDTTTWATAEHTKEAWSQEEITKQVKKLNEGHSVAEKKQKLRHWQQRQVTQVLDRLNNTEPDLHFEWSLAQFDQKFHPVGKQKETTVITVYAKRAPRSDANVKVLYNMENMKKERIGIQIVQPNPQQMQEPIEVDGGFVKISKCGKGKKYDDSSSYSGHSSDTDSGTGYSSSENTSISTRSGRHSKRYSHRGRRSRSRSRRREHRRVSYIDSRAPGSPVLHLPAYVPDAPRAVAAPVEMAAAYQAGRNDADAERLGLDRFAPPRERAIVSHGVLDRYHLDRYPLDTRYADERYADELRLGDEERMRQRDLERRVSRLVNNPFAPHPYSPSLDS
jgi:hypothetical protein